MALQAFWDLAVDVVTGRTVECGMFALVFLELNYLLGVAGEAGFRHVRPETYLQRSVGVFVAAQTSLEFEMGFTHVTLAAFGDIVLYGRWMAVVTAGASDAFVFSSVCLDIGRWLRMTLHAVIV